jgi:carboxymethylenebutenolidase
VVVVHEATGLNSDIIGHTKRIAEAGYVALAPDLYSSGGMLRCLRATFRALRTGRGPAVDDILAARAWLAARPDCTGKVGVIGFCAGGGFALLLAARGFDASAANYAPVPQDTHRVLSGACPIVASYGGKDRIFRDAPAGLTDVLQDLGVEHDVRVYPEAGHSFMNRHRLAPLTRLVGIGYEEAAAEDAWTRILEFFRHHLSS